MSHGMILLEKQEVSVYAPKALLEFLEAKFFLVLKPSQILRLNCSQIPST